MHLGCLLPCFCAGVFEEETGQVPCVSSPLVASRIHSLSHSLCGIQVGSQVWPFVVSYGSHNQQGQIYVGYYHLYLYVSLQRFFRKKSLLQSFFLTSNVCF